MKPFSYLICLLSFFILINCQSNDVIHEEHRSVIKKKPSSSTQASDPYDRYNTFDSLIQELAKEKQLDWMLIKAIIIKESHFDSQFVSTAGAVGLMQLMPRKGSYISTNYQHYKKARLQARAKDGIRYYQGKSIHYWAKSYTAELDSFKLTFQYQPEQLYAFDQRFHPRRNIKEGIRQFASDFNYFRNKGKGSYTSRILSLAAYNAGRGAVNQVNGIPINRQTELYVAYVERIYEALKMRDGKLDEWNDWVLKI